MQIRFLRSVQLGTAAVCLACAHAEVQAQADHLVRNTEALAPAEEMRGFKVPAGFKVQLFADESLIGGKPINMAFDAQGRLWVSSTREYPYAVPKEKWSPDTTAAPGSRDSIRILEDTDGDGRADKVTVFAADLNIPTGILPWKKGCLAWSIPNILYLEDTDEDGKADKRSIVLGPLGYELDTHGMISSMRLGLDGWVYATHGFNNTSHAKAGDGSTLDMQSGNTFRFKPDGSRVEIWTRGQVNPFGMCWDSRGNLYSADCHSSPIYQLIRGAYYPSFGKPHDGLGFAPVTCAHSHGSTGIAGVVYLDGGVWGPEWDDHMLVGNPVTSKVNHDSMTFQGTTPTAREEPDFLTSEDGWFRPVDLHLGPDSALYVVDFYNRIIGHYEVALDHPGRDRARGRIWRVVKEGHTGSLTQCRLRDMDAPALMRELASPNLTRRWLATEELVSRIGQPALRLARQEVTGNPEPPDAPVVSDYAKYLRPEEAGIQDVHALWVAFRLGDEALPSRVARGLMVGGVRQTGEWEQLSAACLTAIGEKQAFAPEGELFEGDGTVCGSQFDARGAFSMRAAGLAMAHHPRDTQETLGILSSMRIEGGREDSHLVLDSGDPALILAWRMAVRTFLAQPGGFARLTSKPKHPPGRLMDEFAFIACAIPSAEAAEWLLDYARVRGARLPELPVKLRHIAKHLPAAREAELVTLVRTHLGGDINTQIELHQAIAGARKDQRPAPDSPMGEWSAMLERQLLALLRQSQASTWHLSTPPSTQNPNPWHPLARKCADGSERVMLDSHPPGGEKLTGTLRSGEFALPERLEFWLAGHNGFPAAADQGKNFVRLVDAASGQELARALPPRNDVARRIVWTFGEDATDRLPRGSSRAYLELTDGDTASAYAWLAAGGFDPSLPALALPEDGAQRDQRVRALALLCQGTESQRSETVAFLAALPHKTSFSAATRGDLAALLARQPEGKAHALLAPAAADAELAPVVFEVLETPDKAAETLKGAFQKLPFRIQVKLATAMTGTTADAEMLLDAAPARVLADPLVASKIKALPSATLGPRLDKLVEKLPPSNQAAMTLINARLKSFPSASVDAQRGQQIFRTHCAACHRIGVTGNLVGPQLDGVGVRGLERLLEDLLDPNRAVDPAFRLHFVKQKNGSLLAGLFRREQEGQLYFADAAGQEHAVAKSDIAEDQVSEFSLMPAGFGELLPEKDLNDLLAYLLARK